MQQTPQIIFVCEHGAAKSIVAAAYFNRLAEQQGIQVRALARGTNPDPVLAEATIQGMENDGLLPTEDSPRLLGAEEAESALRIITFCALPPAYTEKVIDVWDDVPPVSDNYECARAAIVDHIWELLYSIRRSA